MAVPAAPTLVVAEEPLARAARITVTVPATSTRLTLWRTGPSGVKAGVRGYSPKSIGPGELVARDYEIPIGVPVTYSATAGNTDGESAIGAATTFTLASHGCDDTWLTSLVRAGTSQQVVLEHLEELTYEVPSSVHSIIGRRTPIISGDVAHTPSFELAFLTDTDTQREQARTVLGNGVPVLLRTPPEQGIGNLYFAVTEFAEQRIVPLGSQPARRFVVAAIQVERPAAVGDVTLTPAGYTYVKATFATYTALRSGRASYDALLYDWSGAAAPDIVPWPPDDV